MFTLTLILIRLMELILVGTGIYFIFIGEIHSILMGGILIALIIFLDVIFSKKLKSITGV